MNYASQGIQGICSSIKAQRHKGTNDDIPALIHFRTNRCGLGEGQSRDLESRDFAKQGKQSNFLSFFLPSFLSLLSLSPSAVSPGLFLQNLLSSTYPNHTSFPLRLVRVPIYNSAARTITACVWLHVTVVLVAIAISVGEATAGRAKDLRRGKVKQLLSETVCAPLLGPIPLD